MNSNKILDGYAVALKWLKQTKKEIDLLKQQGQKICLAIVLQGDNFASQIYIKNKIQKAHELGVEVDLIKIDADMNQNEFLKKINQIQNNKKYTGVLIQLPLSKQIDEQVVFANLNHDVDVDGFSWQNIAANATYKKIDIENTVCSCTPKGIIYLLKAYNIDLQNKHVVIINRSNIVGKPLFNLLLSQNATVTVCHSYTQNLAQITKQADIIISAVGKPGFITLDHVNSNSIVIDVSINRNENNKLCGDIIDQAVFAKIKHYSPVPKGIGPLTIAAIFSNLVLLAKQKNNF